MRTMHTVVKRGALYWDRDLLPPSLYEGRLATIRSRIRQHGDAGWLLVGDVVRHGPVVYATNFMPRVRSALVFVAAEGPPVLFANISTRDIPAARLITDVEEIRAFSRLPKDLTAFLEERLPDGGRVATCGVETCLPWTDWRAIEMALPKIAWVGRDDELRDLRREKAPAEVEAIRRSTQLADLALDLGSDVLRAGKSMREVTAELDRAARRRGAEDVRLLIAAGPQTQISLRPPDDRRLEDGDPVMIYCAVQHQRYWGEAAQTFSLGPPSAQQKEACEAARALLEAMTVAARAGATTDALGALAEAHLGQRTEAAASFGFGSGIGLDLEESPSLDRRSTDRLRPGETMALHVVLPGAMAAGTVTTGTDGATRLGLVRPALIEIGKESP